MNQEDSNENIYRLNNIRDNGRSRFRNISKFYEGQNGGGINKSQSYNGLNNGGLNNGLNNRNYNSNNSDNSDYQSQSYNADLYSVPLYSSSSSSSSTSYSSSSSSSYSSSSSSSSLTFSPFELRRAIYSTQQFFFTHQHPDGYWVAELEGDALLQSETILLLAFLGEEKSDLANQCAIHLLDTQLPDGGWGMYTGSKSDINNTVKAYFALKLTGHPSNADYMQKARVRALELGGVDCVNSFTRFYLAILGQIPHSVCPAVPPQIMLLPRWFPINIYSMSAWSRTIFVPLSIVSSLAPVRQIPHEFGIKEIFIETPDKWKPLVAPGKKQVSNPFSWDAFFRCCNSLMWACRKLGITPLRKKGIELAKQWTIEHCKNSDGPGAIYPPIIWGWIAFKSLGYADDSAEIKYFRNQLESHIIRNTKRGSVRIQPCKSPVWDTALTLKALMLGGLNATNPAVRKGLQWIRSRHIKQDGDWSKNVKNVKSNVGGWCFEFNNAFYPDSDDTAMALMVLAGRFDEAKTINKTPDNPLSTETSTATSAMSSTVSSTATSAVSSTAASAVSSSRQIILRLSEIRDAIERNDNNYKAGSLPPDLRLLDAESDNSFDNTVPSELDIAETTSALESGLRWLLAMQNKDGGWGAFDHGNNKEILCKVPFADHNAMIDPSTPDLTGRVMESLGRLGYRVGQSAVIDRVVSYMRKEQQADGSWFGRWGVNYIYGTWQALTGLTSVGIETDDPAVVAGASWLISHQHSSGGWGESPDSYFDASLRGYGTPTASQTAWALMGLIAAGKHNSDAVKQGIRFLLDRQREDGTWYEPEFTGTGFPLVFYLKYHYYSVYFPLMALSLYAAKSEVANVSEYENEIILSLTRVKVFSPEKEFYNNKRSDDKPEIFEITKPISIQIKNKKFSEK
jgi:squalene-hopene/tetraprenyl-beta-curcumene cyclase